MAVIIFIANKNYDYWKIVATIRIAYKMSRMLRILLTLSPFAKR